jgi:bifunctional non-homologous end joining protein LigD
MLATPGPVPAGPGWAVEFKWDGMRAQVAAAGNRWRVWTRTGRDATASFPELAALPALVAGRPAALDGELVALDPAGAPSFARLQRRIAVRRPGPHLLREVPVMLYAFDVLHLDGQATTALPYEQRRQLLEALTLDADTVATPPAFVDAGAEVFAVAADRGLEGVVAKRLGSRYEPGRRSRAWVKTPVPRTTTAVMCGWLPGTGRRRGTIGAVVLGAHDRAGRLRHVGQVGTGFTTAALNDLRLRFAPLQRASPPIPALRYPHAVWLDPVLVCRVAFRAWTPDGHLRHPSWRGVVDEARAEQVQLPTDLDQ